MIQILRRYSLYFLVTAAALAATAPALKITTTSPLTPGPVGVAYSLTLTASGGTAPYAWTISTGTLPTGLTLSSTGVLSGSPTAAAVYKFTVKVTDSAKASASTAMQLTITPPALTVTTTSPLPAGQVKTAYSVTLAVTGGTPPYENWTTSSGALPPGLALSSAGALTGTPTTAGSYNFTVSVTDQAKASASAALLLTINPPALAIATASPLPAGQVNVMYSQSLGATGGTPPYANWSTNNAALPSGLTLTASGLLRGTPTAAGTFGFIVQVADSAGATASTPFQLIINPPALSIASTSPLPAGQVNSSYSQSLAASGGTPPYANWTVSNGALPSGLTLTSSGVVSGTPTAPGAFIFTVQVSDHSGASASAPLQLTITPGKLVITTPSPLPQGQVNAAYSQFMSAAGGAPPYSWGANSRAPGLAFSSTGVWSGTPSTAGTYGFNIQVTDSAGVTVSASFQLTVKPLPPSITTASPLPAGQVNTAYSQALTAADGSPPYMTWTVTTGTVPPGLALSSSTLRGIPATAGSYSFTVQVTDSAGANASAGFQLVINPSPLTIATSALPAGQVNTRYSQSLTATGGTPPYNSWAASGVVPGLVFSSAGVWSGMPTAAGTYNFTVQVTDSVGGSAAKSFQLEINAPPLAITTTSPLPAGQLNSGYSQTLVATGGTPPSTWATAGGTLPSGITLSQAGVLSGTPTSAGTYNFTVRAMDSAGALASAQFQLTINTSPLTITTASPLPAGQVNAGYSQALTASGGTPPYTNWTLSGGALPLGLTLASALFSGTPTAAGTCLFTLQVTDSAGASASASFQLTINALGSTPAPGVLAVVSSTSFVAGTPVSTGSWVAIFGTNLAPAGDSRMWNAATDIVNGRLPLSLDGTSVSVDGKAAAVEYISPGQVNIQLPDDTALGPVPVVVTTSAGASSAFSVTYANFAPGFFPATAPHIVAQHADSSYVTSSSPAQASEVIILWGGGMGPGRPAVPTGQMFSGASPLVNPIVVTIGGLPASVDFAGVVGPGLVQINVHVPAGIANGDQAVIATVGGVSSPPDSYISVGIPSATPQQMLTIIE